jgi:hypothetical protein
MKPKDVIAQAEDRLEDVIKFHPLNETAWEYTKDDMRNFLSSYTKDLLQSVVGEIERIEKEPLLTTSGVEEICRCDFENGDIIELDKDEKHTKCGKKLPMAERIIPSSERIISSLSDILKEIDPQPKRSVKDHPLLNNEDR